MEQLLDYSIKVLWWDSGQKSPRLLFVPWAYQNRVPVEPRTTATTSWIDLTAGSAAEKFASVAARLSTAEKFASVAARLSTATDALAATDTNANRCWIECDSDADADASQLGSYQPVYKRSSYSSLEPSDDASGYALLNVATLPQPTMITPEKSTLMEYFLPFHIVTTSAHRYTHKNAPQSGTRVSVNSFIQIWTIQSDRVSYNTVSHTWL